MSKRRLWQLFTGDSPDLVNPVWVYTKSEARAVFKAILGLPRIPVGKFVREVKGAA